MLFQIKICSISSKGYVISFIVVYLGCRARRFHWILVVFIMRWGRLFGLDHPRLRRYDSYRLGPSCSKGGCVIHWISCYPVDEICQKNSTNIVIRILYRQNEGKSIGITGLCRNHAKSIKRNTLAVLDSDLSSDLNIRLSGFWTTEAWFRCPLKCPKLKSEMITRVLRHNCSILSGKK